MNVEEIASQIIFLDVGRKTVVKRFFFCEYF